VPTHTVLSSPSPHITYTVSLRGPSRTWTVQKRYSEFQTLHLDLTTETSLPPTVPLPPKHFSLFGSSALSDPVRIEERRRGLEGYLRGVLYSAETAWRRSCAWKTFLDLQVGSTGGEAGTTLSGTSTSTSTTTTSMTPQAWMSEHEALRSLTREIRANVAKRDRCVAQNDVQGAQSAAVAGKVALRSLETRLGVLERSLKAPPGTDGSGGGGGVAKGERQRRQDLFGSLVGEAEGVARALSSSTLSASTALSASAARLTPQQTTDRNALLGSPNPSRRFGTAASSSSSSSNNNNNAAFSSMEPQALLGQQQELMAVQDDALTSLSSIIRRQKEIGMAIGQELDLQNGLLEEVDDQVGRVQGRLAGTTKKLDRVLKG
ncbi:hypothetical protein HKX48_009268, partial [Thoreauomyces humboldtii]